MSNHHFLTQSSCHFSLTLISPFTCFFFHWPFSPLSSFPVHLSSHHFSLCHYTTIPPILLATLPLHPPFLTCYHFLLNPLICPSFPHPVIATWFFTGTLSSTLISLSCPIPTCLFPSLLFPLILIIIHQYLLIFPSGFLSLRCLLFLAFSPSTSLSSSSVYHRVMFWHFSYSNLVPVFTHQTVFILLSLCHVIFLIFSPCRSSTPPPPPPPLFDFIHLCYFTLSPLCGLHAQWYIDGKCSKCNAMIKFNKFMVFEHNTNSFLWSRRKMDWQYSVWIT